LVEYDRFKDYELFTIIGSMIVLVGMLLFAVIVLRYGARSKAQS